MKRERRGGGRAMAPVTLAGVRVPPLRMGERCSRGGARVVAAAGWDGMGWEGRG
jgi:hypothetical protein